MFLPHEKYNIFYIIPLKDSHFPYLYPNTFFSGHTVLRYQSPVNYQVSGAQLLNSRPNSWEGQHGTGEWVGGTLSSESVLSQDSWGLSEGKKRNINPNGEGGGCEGN